MDRVRAYKVAYGPMKNDSAYVSACRLFKNVKVMCLLHRETSKMLGKLDLTPESLLRDIQGIKIKALQAKNPNLNAALRAVNLQGKYLGLLGKTEDRLGESGISGESEGKILILPSNGREVDQKGPKLPMVKKKKGKQN